MTIGIYCITNTLTNRRYIGSSKNIETRFNRHVMMLNNNIHHNMFLQRDFNKNCSSIEDLSFDIIEECEQSKLIELEDYYINNFKNLYNMGPARGGDIISNHPNKDDIIKKSIDVRKSNGTYGTPGLPKGITYEVFYGEDRAKELKHKLSENAKSRTGDKNPFYGKTYTNDTKKIISEANKRRKGTTKYQYIVNFPCGKTESFNGLYALKDCLNVSYPVIYKNINKGVVSHKTSKLYGYEIKKI